MRHTRGLITIPEALQQVFNLSVKTPTRPALRLWRGITFCPLVPHFSTSALRPATYKPIRKNPASFSSPVRRRAPEPREIDLSRFGVKVDRPLRDEEISVQRAHVKLPDNKLSPPQSLGTILDGRAKDSNGKYSQFVQELAPADPHNGREYSILGYFDKKELKEQELALKKRNRQSVLKEKNIELSWSIDENDLQHRLARLKEFLEKGNRVEVVLGSMKSRGWNRKRKVTEEDAGELLKRFRQVASEVEGTKVIRELKGKLLELATIVFQGPGKNAKGTNEKDQEVLEDT